MFCPFTSQRSVEEKTSDNSAALKTLVVAVAIVVEVAISATLAEKIEVLLTNDAAVTSGCATLMPSVPLIAATIFS